MELASIKRIFSGEKPAQSLAPKAAEKVKDFMSNRPQNADRKIKFLAFEREIMNAAEAMAETGGAEVLSVLRRLGLDGFSRLMWSLPLESYPHLSKTLPKMTDLPVQAKWTGQSGLPLMVQSISFVRAVADDYSRLTGRSLTDATMLDFGCGYGRFLRLMTYYSDPNKVHGCDPLEASLDQCRSCDIPNAIELSDYVPETLPFSDKSFDFAFAFSVFTHTSGNAMQAALKALRLVVKDDGVLAITIRPEEYWNINPVYAKRAEAMIAAHRTKGLAFAPHSLNTSTDIPAYGDTSVSLKKLAEIAEDWDIVGTNISSEDFYQIIVLLKPKPKPKPKPNT